MLSGPKEGQDLGHGASGPDYRSGLTTEYGRGFETEKACGNVIVVEREGGPWCGGGGGLRRREGGLAEGNRGTSVRVPFSTVPLENECLGWRPGVWT